MAYLDWLALTLILIASGGILLLRRWRWNIGFLAIQYLGVFWLVQTEWNIALAAVKLVAGWMVCAVLGIAHLNNSKETDPSETFWSQGRLFRLAAIGMVTVVTFTGAIGLRTWLVMAFPAAWGSLLLVGMGLLSLGISTQPFRVIVGLLTALSGFEVIYAAVESSALVTGLLVVINLGLALAGAYFLNLPASEELP
jgi:hypothetical protein